MLGSRAHLGRLLELSQQLGQRRNALIPLEQRRERAALLPNLGVQAPYVIGDGAIVSVDDRAVGLARMTGDVYLQNPADWFRLS